MPEPQTLYLLRHADAEPWLPGVDDFARSLNERGRWHMRKLSEWAARNLAAPGLVLCSPAARTRETLAPFLERWPDLQQVSRYEADIYEAQAGTLQTLADAGFATIDRLMMVGHNPGFENLAHAVLSDRVKARLTKLAPGSLAVIEFPGGWAADMGRGRLRHWKRRRDFGHG
jgi:phosphohistidine phosphatase